MNSHASKHLFFVRHGQASFGEANYDNLSQQGWQQSEVLGQALQKNHQNFQKIFSGPHQRHFQTFQGIEKGYGEKMSSCETIQGFAENQLMEIAMYFIPKMLNSDLPAQTIFKQMPIENRDSEFLKLFQQVAKKWMKNELDLSEQKFESYPDFLSRIQQTISYLDSVTDSGDNVLIVTSGGTITAVYALATQCSDEEILKLNFGIKNVSVTDFNYYNNTLDLKNFNKSYLPKELETYI
jgi:broad specificity phosphatase PhoE